MSTERTEQDELQPFPPPRSRAVPLVLVALGAVVLIAGALLLSRATAATNQVALAASPKGVTVVEARPAEFRPLRRYVGTIEPWVEARIGPQLVAAYVQTVLVRPGDTVKRGQVLATLDCRNASALAKQVSAQAQALEQTQAALAKEAARVGTLLEGGFVSANEVEQRTADSASKAAQLLALRARLLGTDLQVADCVLRAPFDGEVALRHVDPGAFVRPGAAIISLVDRRTLRVTAEVPESDFDAVAPLSPVKLHVIATGDELSAAISRRAPAAAAGTRTVHVEIDLPNPQRHIPAGATAELRVDVGSPRPALEVPLPAATVRGAKASLVVVANGVAHKATAAVLGEREGRLYLDPALGPGAWVVTEGRGGLVEGDHVEVHKAVVAGPALEQHHASVLEQSEHAQDHDGPREPPHDAKAVRE